jgi:hypothetical protein
MDSPQASGQKLDVDKSHVANIQSVFERFKGAQRR